MLNLDIWWADVNPLLAFFCALSRERDRYQEDLKNKLVGARDCKCLTGRILAYN